MMFTVYKNEIFFLLYIKFKSITWSKKIKETNGQSLYTNDIV
jgi:hypothetical protein